MLSKALFSILTKINVANTMHNLSKKIKNIPFRLIKWIFLHREYNVQKLGGECKWIFCPMPINSESILYSGGVGRDISFEHEIVKMFGCKILLFDPSPPGEATMTLIENQIPEFHFTPIGLAGKPCTLCLNPPSNGDVLGSSWTSSEKISKETIEVECVDICTLMKKNGHDKIDLLKIDIEGAEYGVIDQLLKEQLPVMQILVEYHHGIIPGIPCFRSVFSIMKLIKSGYHMIAIDSHNYTFIHKSAWNS